MTLQYNYPADHWKRPYAYIFEAANKGALQGHISSQLPITAGWTEAFVWFFRALPKPYEIFEGGTMPGFEPMIFWPQGLHLSYLHHGPLVIQYIGDKN